MFCVCEQVDIKYVAKTDFDQFITIVINLLYFWETAEKQ